MKPAAAARLLADDYFRSRGMESPETQADRFLPRVRIYTETGEWRSDTLVETGAAILDAQAFDVDDLVENHLHATLSIESLRDFDKTAGSPVFGLAYVRAWEIVICERAEKYLPLYRTSVAHEIAHLLLHGDRAAAGGMCYSPDAIHRHAEEREADAFMVALLAPESIIKLAVGLAATRSGLNLAHVWRRADTEWGRRNWKTRIFPRLIDRLCLSRLLLIIRMLNFGVFTQETAEFHKSYALPNRWRGAN